jgi:2-amino-4-hydroxy-6-hydroxymethyldihydropteridine diphosphokinase
VGLPFVVSVFFRGAILTNRKNNMADLYLGLGSNLGDRKRNITNATMLIGGLMGKLKVLSSLYETEPWGFESEHKFMNAVVLVETEHEPELCLKMVNAIEREMGRIRTGEAGFHDRPIDIDLLLYDDRIIDTPDLKVPHPLMLQRDFVLRPLAEIAPDLIHPVAKKSIRELFEILK